MSDLIGSDYNPIFKVNLLVDGLIDKIYVFLGNVTPPEEDDVELFKKIFTDDELENIEKNKIDIVFSKQRVYFDDSISTLKIKLLMELGTNASFEEMYLFCRQRETFNAVSVYRMLTQNKRIELTDIILNQFLANIVSESDGNPINTLEYKETYTFEDILELKLDNKVCVVNKALGQKFFVIENEYPFVCNPFDVLSYDSFFERSVRKSLSTLNGNLVLSSGKFINNSIYLCLAKDVLTSVSEKGISEEITTKIYYPFLHNKQFDTLDKLLEVEHTLRDGNGKYVNDKTTKLFKTVDMFYDIYLQKKSDLKYLNKGIQYVNATIMPDFTITVPLETIFKLLHASKTCPLIKYNPSSKHEKIYRLYADKIAVDGRRIPYMKKSDIFKYMKTIAKNKAVSVCIEQIIKRRKYTLICEFNENCSINISSQFETVLSIDDVDDILKQSIGTIRRGGC